MDFFLVFCKNRKKFDKYIKNNRIKRKTIVDIKEIINEYDIDVEKNREYFNLIVYTKIVHSFKKNKNVYYIPNFDNLSKINIKEFLKLKELIMFDININLLLFYDEIVNENAILEKIYENIHIFDVAHVIKDY